MKNILEILKDAGIDLTEEQTTTLQKAVAENYKTVAEFDKKIGKLETERDGYKTQLETATEALKGFDGIDVEDLQAKLTEAQNKAQEAEKEFQAQLAARDFDDALKAEISSLRFTSKAAEASITQQIKDAGLKLVNGKIMGFRDFVETLRESDADAFATDDDGNEPASFTATIATKGGKAFKDMTLNEKMAYANAHPSSVEVRSWLGNK